MIKNLLAVLIIISSLFLFGQVSFDEDEQTRQFKKICDIKCDEKRVSWELYYNTAIYHFYNAEHELALYNFMRALELNSNEIKIYPYIIYALGSLEGGKRGLTPIKELRTPFFSRKPYGKNENAEKIFEEIFEKGKRLGEELKKDVKNDEARFYLGMLYAAAANFTYRIKGEKLKSKDLMEKAVEEFKIILMNRNSKYYWKAVGYLGGINFIFGRTNWLIKIFLRNLPKDKEKGIKMLYEAYLNDSDNNEAAFFLFSSLYVEKRFIEARKLVIELIKRYPMNFELKEYLVYIDLVLGRNEEALDVCLITLKDLSNLKGTRYEFLLLEFQKALQEIQKKLKIEVVQPLFSFIIILI